MDYLTVTYRDIAKMLASALPVEDDAYGVAVNEYLDVIKRLPQAQKTALKVAYVFSRKVPREEREDLFQELCLALFKARTKEEKLCYAIARCDWLNWWKRYKRHSQYFTADIDEVVQNDTGESEVPLRELLVGEVEFENKVNGKLEAERLWTLIPEGIKPLVSKRLTGRPLTNTERHKMAYYVKTQGYKLLI